MADETRASGEPAGPPRRRRVPPPTIDLQATPADAPASGAPDAAPPDAAPPDPAAGEPADPGPSSAAASPPPPADDPPPPRSAPPDSRPAPNRWWPPLAAGVLGAALALAAGWWARFGVPRDGAGDVTARLARAEARLGELARQDATAAADPRSET